MLPEKEYAEGLKAISEADTLIVAGTSLKVDIDADIQINDSIGNVFKQIKTKD